MRDRTRNSLRFIGAVAALAVAVAGAGRRAHGQFLQLVELHGAGRAGGLHQGNRHQGRLRHLRRQRDAGDAAARRKIRLRRRRSHRLFPAAPDHGKGFPEARQVEAAEPRQRLAGGDEAARDLRSRQQLRRQLHVGHHGHRLQRQDGAEDSWARTPKSTAGTSSSSRRTSQNSRIAASTCWIPPTTFCPRR